MLLESSLSERSVRFRAHASKSFVELTMPRMSAFFLTYDDTSILQPCRLVAVSKSIGEIVYDDSANDEG
jgi:hypothetical protein